MALIVVPWVRRFEDGQPIRAPKLPLRWGFSQASSHLDTGLLAAPERLAFMELEDNVPREEIVAFARGPLAGEMLVHLVDGVRLSVRGSFEEITAAWSAAREGA